MHQHLGRDALKECLVSNKTDSEISFGNAGFNKTSRRKSLPPHQRHGILLLAPAWIAADLDALRPDARSQLSQVLSDLALRQRRGNAHTHDPFPLGVGQPRQNKRGEAL